MNKDPIGKDRLIKLSSELITVPSGFVNIEDAGEIKISTAALNS